MRLKFQTNLYLATAYKIAVAVFLLWLTRFFFIVYNAQSAEVQTFSEAMRLSLHGLRFDICAAAYFNLPFLAMRVVPQPLQFRPAWIKSADWVYYVCNALMLAINIGDTPYYNFTGMRLRWSNVMLVATDDGAGLIFLKYLGAYWWVVLTGAVFIALLVWLSSRVGTAAGRRESMSVRLGMFVLFGALAFVAMRGKVQPGKIPPLSISDAAYAAEKTPQINVVLNSPFCLLRSLNPKKNNMERKLEFFSEEELLMLRGDNIHHPSDSAKLKRRNIVTVIIESGGAEWMDFLTAGHTPGSLRLMPFLDSIASRSVVVRDVMATGRTSIGGFTAITGGFPAFDGFYYMHSPYNKNTVDSPASLLKDEGWTTVFYYGVNPGSFTIDQMARAMGYEEVRDRYSYGSQDDFDGEWGIFDVPMAEYVVSDLGKTAQPFMAAWFTISAHGPFPIPDGFDTSSFVHKERGPERGLEYTDVALRRFFELAERQPWYSNTTFVITGDHGNRDFSTTPYGRDYLRNRLPFIVYTPDGSLSPKVYSDRVAAQYDIPATILALAGYDKPFFSLGNDMLGDASKLFSVYRGDGGRYMFVDSGRAVYADSGAERVEAVYNPTSDPFFEHPLAMPDTLASALMQKGQAFLQDYTQRLNSDRMSVRRETPGQGSVSR